MINTRRLAAFDASDAQLLQAAGVTTRDQLWNDAGDLSPTSVKRAALKFGMPEERLVRLLSIQAVEDSRHVPDGWSTHAGGILLHAGWITLLVAAGFALQGFVSGPLAGLIPSKKPEPLVAARNDGALDGRVVMTVRLGAPAGPQRSVPHRATLIFSPTSEKSTRTPLKIEQALVLDIRTVGEDTLVTVAVGADAVDPVTAVLGTSDAFLMYPATAPPRERERVGNTP